MDDYAAEAICPRVEAAFEMLAKKWTGLIIRALLPGDLCFSALERAIPSLSARVLSLRVRELEEAGILNRSVSADPPVRVSYSLTEKGRALEPIIRAITAWALEWGPDGIHLR